MAFDQSVSIGSLTLKNPVLTASGTFGYALEYDDFYDVATLGGICTKGLSLTPLVGNAPNRICETAAGMLDNASPEERIRAEVEEEAGYRLHDVRKVFEAFMSPGAITEKLHFFVAEYEPRMKIGGGGGIADEGEDIEVLELPIDQALTMIGDGRIADAKTIMLLQYAALNIFG